MDATPARWSRHRYPPRRGRASYHRKYRPQRLRHPLVSRPIEHGDPGLDRNRCAVAPPHAAVQGRALRRRPHRTRTGETAQVRRILRSDCGLIPASSGLGQLLGCLGCDVAVLAHGRRDHRPGATRNARSAPTGRRPGRPVPARLRRGRRRGATRVRLVSPSTCSAKVFFGHMGQAAEPPNLQADDHLEKCQGRGRIPAANSLVPSVNVVVVNDVDELLLIPRTDNGNWAVPSAAVDLGGSVTPGGGPRALEESGIECAITGIVGIYAILYTSNGEAQQEFSIVLTARPLRSGQPTPRKLPMRSRKPARVSRRPLPCSWTRLRRARHARSSRGLPWSWTPPVWRKSSRGRTVRFRRCFLIRAPQPTRAARRRTQSIVYSPGRSGGREKQTPAGGYSREPSLPGSWGYRQISRPQRAGGTTA